MSIQPRVSIFHNWRHCALGAAFMLAATCWPLAGQAAAATAQPTRFVKDVQVVTSSDSGVACPTGYSRNDQDLNQGSGGAYVFACLAYTPNPGEAIEELYVNVSFPPAGQDELGRATCLGDDQIVRGDLNDGVSNGGISHETLTFCIHRPGTNGGSGILVNPNGAVGSHPDYFPARPTKLLTGLNFVTFANGNLPNCVNTDCVDAGVGGFVYLEAGVTVEPYCQQHFGTDWNPIFRPWQYHGNGDQNADTPQDSQIYNLNAGSPTAPIIYGCGQFDTVTPLVTDATVQPGNQPYTAGSWTNQNVLVEFSCSGAQTALLSGLQFTSEAANQTATSSSGGASCVDRFGQPAAPITFGPINIDRTPPKVQFSGNQGTYTVDQTVSITCAAVDPTLASGAAGSGIASSTCQNQSAPAYTFGQGQHQLTATATDAAGNTASATATFSVQVTLAGLETVTSQLLGQSNPAGAQDLVSILKALEADPTHQAFYLKNYQDYLSEQVLQGALVGQGVNANLLRNLSLGLPAVPSGPTSVNDTDPNIHYSGSWTYYANRPFGDLNGDVHATTHDGDSAAYTFTGTGISYITERSVDSGPVDVQVDGVLQTTVNAQANVINQANQTLYSIWGLPMGQHTLTITKRGNNWMLLDAFIVQTAGQTVNDTDAKITYSGPGWGYYAGRPASVGDLQQDVHATVDNGDSAAYTFNGTGIAYITEKSADEGLVDVYVDGVLQQTVDAGPANLHNQGGQVLFAKTGLNAGSHEIKLVKKSGTYLLVDGFTVMPWSRPVKQSNCGVATEESPRQSARNLAMASAESSTPISRL